MGGFEEILHQDEVGLTIAHHIRHALDGIKIHHDSSGEGLYDRRNILANYDHGFDDSSDHGYLNRID
jgi:hypothetical protein